MELTFALGCVGSWRSWRRRVPPRPRHSASAPVSLPPSLPPSRSCSHCPEVHRGNAHIFGGNAAVFGGDTAVLGGGAALFGGGADVFGGEQRRRRGEAT
eukprot:1406096-Rhodomonas_salina.1